MPFNTRAITDDWSLNGLPCQVMNLIDNSFCSAHRRVMELFSLFCAALRQNAAFSADLEAAFMTLSHFSGIKNKLKWNTRGNFYFRFISWWKFQKKSVCIGRELLFDPRKLYRKIVSTEVAQKAARVMQSILVYHWENCYRHNASQFDYVATVKIGLMGTFRWKMIFIIFILLFGTYDNGNWRQRSVCKTSFSKLCLRHQIMGFEKGYKKFRRVGVFPAWVV